MTSLSVRACGSYVVVVVVVGLYGWEGRCKPNISSAHIGALEKIVLHLDQEYHR